MDASTTMVVGLDDADCDGGAGCDGDGKVVEGASCKAPSSPPREGLISSISGIALPSGPRLVRAASMVALDEIDLPIGRSLDEDALITLEEILSCLASGTFLIPDDQDEHPVEQRLRHLVLPEAEPLLISLHVVKSPAMPLSQPQRPARTRRCPNSMPFDPANRSNPWLSVPQRFPRQIKLRNHPGEVVVDEREKKPLAAT